MSNFVFVLNSNKEPLAPVHPGFARRLLKQQQAAVYRRYPFTIILFDSRPLTKHHYQLKLDPGSKTTGVAIVNHDQVIWASEISHRGEQIKSSLETRRQIRRGSPKQKNTLS